MTAYSGIRCVPVVLCAAAVHACAARTALYDYRRAVIDRPFTLPAGVDSFHVGILGGYARDDFNSAGRAGAPVGWDLSLSDDSTLHLSPLQLGISRQMVRTEDSWLGATLGFGVGAGSEGVLLSPNLGLAHRIRLTRSVAWSTAVAGRLSRWTDQPAWGWSATLAGGPLWQVTEAVALQPLVGVSVGRSNLLLRDLPLDRTSRVTFPLVLGATFSVARQWDVQTALAYEGIGYEGGYRAFTGTVGFAHTSGDRKLQTEPRPSISRVGPP